MTPPPAELRGDGAAAPRGHPEDTVRAGDRARVEHARRGGHRFRLVWLLVGPGILVMLAENDGPSMISYAASGATYGLGFFLPFIVVTFAMAIVCQEMCMRVGAVTHRGYGQLVLERFGPAWGWLAAGDLLLTNLVTLIAEFVAIRVGLAYFHLGPVVAAALGLVLVVLTLSGGRYWRWERLVLGLAVFNGLFLLAAILVRPALGLGRTRARDLLAAASGEHEHDAAARRLDDRRDGHPLDDLLPAERVSRQGADAPRRPPRPLGHDRGRALAALFGCGALIAGSALAGHHGSTIQGLSGAGFPALLRSVSGGAVGTVFALGLIEAGAVALLTISASTGYAVGECIGVSSSFNNSPRAAAPFYGANIAVALIAAAIILIPGAPLLRIALNANVLATVLLPITLIFMIMLANDRELMGARGSTAG